MAAIGLGVRLTMAAALALLPLVDMSRPVMMMAVGLLLNGGLLVSVGYLGAIAVIVSSGRAAGLMGLLARVGRMALTNYLLETLIATTIMYHYGLAMFGLTTRAERIGIVLGVYAGLAVFSVLWLSVFRMG